MASSKEFITDFLMESGIEINGKNPWDIVVGNEKFYDRVLAQGNMGLGESYMDGWWNSPNIDQFIYRLLRNGAHEKIKPSINTTLHYFKAKFFNFQNKSRASIVAEHHYDLGNDLYEKMLGKTMAYTCGYWKDAKTLDQAQIAKMDLVCKKVGLKPGMKVLDIGCGFGSFMKYASENYGVECVGITLSKEQIAFGKEFCKGFPVEFRLLDYRDLNDRFDRVISIGMFEAVGYKNFKTFMQSVNNCLVDDGIFLLHTIGNNASTTATDPWLDKYIFPNGMLPSIEQIGKSIEKIFVMEDWHNFGQYYDPTLMAWHENFEKSWPDLKDKYGDRFYRMWKYYLLSCAALFRAREVQLWQIVLTKRGIVGGYESIR